ncbi:LytTR family DNA-binding domain-containing protein [Thermomonas sp.]|uniref:LytTR family DNA-binding domain-containing protein n=1 Tax=Thermomonas sp. TaxID=1971895 RepID=UPI002489F3FA|nr:LytTR family DNA-binding domain-containing protein [Thermomonas sp.]MDI1253579.1 LytTR family DNA-binding domain-containing protein [Thermomonas sp.]
MSPPKPASPNAWERYQPYRRVTEIGYWVIGCLIGAMSNAATVLMDIRRSGLHFDAWEPMVWEWSSALVTLALVPVVVWYSRRVPLHLDNWRRALPLHLLGSVGWSILHVAGMVALRKLAYAMQGTHYDFGNWPREFGYEYLKDIRSYAAMVATIEVYRWFLRRLQGEASVLSAADDLPAAERPQRPERFLVRKLGKEFLVNANEVEWLQASGNYMNLHVRGRAYPLRSTMAVIETQLDPAKFVRVHRSHIVNLDCVAEIQPLDTGDARIVMRDGSQIPCSRRHRDALRPAAA